MDIISKIRILDTERILGKKVKHDLRQSSPLRSMVFQFAGFTTVGELDAFQVPWLLVKSIGSCQEGLF